MGNGILKGDNAKAVYGTEVQSSGVKLGSSAGVAEQLVAEESKYKCSGVFLKPLDTNTKNVYLGDSTVGQSNTAYFLEPSSAPQFYPIGDPSRIYLNVDVSGEGVAYWPT